MRIAILSDIHGNLTAFNAVLADLQQTSPDLVLHGGDLADAGSSPTEIIESIRDLGWQGVMGNTDEMLVQPSSLEEFATTSSAPPALWTAIREIATATRDALGEDRLAWLRELPRINIQESFALVHATPHTCWRAPAPDSTDAELDAIYGSLEKPTVIFAHTHLPSIRNLNARLMLLINTGSVGLPYDGDPRASYLLLNGSTPSIRRVEYDLEKELKALASCNLPGAEWTTRMLRTSSPQIS
ncbi:MAG TPA: metallophosphoesterase family protein [Edaphobacter sp.]|jgi:putative phosphoesterase|nr:metallophosphoesterase family protein [Edaphobacter sp.]